MYNLKININIARCFGHDLQPYLEFQDHTEMLLSKTMIAGSPLCELTASSPWIG